VGCGGNRAGVGLTAVGFLCRPGSARGGPDLRASQSTGGSPGGCHYRGSHPGNLCSTFARCRWLSGCSARPTTPWRSAANAAANRQRDRPPGGWLVRLDTQRVIWSEEVCRIHEVERALPPLWPRALSSTPRSTAIALPLSLPPCVETGCLRRRAGDYYGPASVGCGARHWPASARRPGHPCGCAGAFQTLPLKAPEASLQRRRARGSASWPTPMPLIVWQPHGWHASITPATPCGSYTGVYAPRHSPPNRPG
jgi:hypothetical protein